MGLAQIPPQGGRECGDLNQIAYPIVIDCTIELFCPKSRLLRSQKLTDFAKLKSYNRLRHLELV